MTIKPICTRENCPNKIVKKDNEEIPRILVEISDELIDSVLSETVEAFHVHEYGSTVIFLEFLEGMELNNDIVEEYSKQGHVFFLPIKALDLVKLKDKTYNSITYKASTEENETWYKIIISRPKTIKDKIFKVFH